MDAERMAFTSSPLEAVPISTNGSMESRTAIFLNKRNRKVVNTECDAEYEVVAGAGIFTVWKEEGKVSYQVKAGDKVSIPANTPYRDEGRIVMISTCRPAFSPEQVILLEDADEPEEVQLFRRTILRDDEDSIELRQFVPEDSGQMFDLIDADRKHLSRYGDDTAKKYKTVESVRKSIVYHQNAARLRFGIWEDNVMVGSINLTVADADCAELGYWVGKEHIGHNYAARATRLMTDFAFNKLKIAKVNAFVTVGNNASRRSLEKSGFSYIGEVEDKDSKDWLFELYNPKYFKLE